MDCLNRCNINKKFHRPTEVTQFVVQIPVFNFWHVITICDLFFFVDGINYVVIPLMHLSN